MPPEDEVLPAEEQPLPAAVSPTVNSDSDPEEDPQEDPTDYPADGGDDNDDDDESSDDDEDDVEEEEDEDEEEEEHLASADSIPSPAYRTTARISIPAQAPVPFLSEAEVERLLALSTPPPSPLTPLSSTLPQIPSPPLPASPTHPLGYRTAMIRLKAESPSTSHPLPLPLPIFLPWKRLCIAPGPRFKIEESSSAPTARPTRGFRADYGFVGTLDTKIRHAPEREIGYRITDTWDEMVEAMQEVPVTGVTELSQRKIDFVTTVRHDTYEIYGRLDDAQDDRSLMSGMETVDGCSDTARYEVMALRTTVLAQLTKIVELQAADRRRQTHLTEALTLMWTLQTQKMAPKRTTRSTPATTTTTTTPVTNAQLKALIDQGVADALAARDADRSWNGKDSHDSGTDVRRQASLSRECTYPDFMKYKPLYFKGTEGVVELTQWFERMETVFGISNCTMENQIKFASCTLLRSALTWWNSHVRTVGHDVVYAMTWTDPKKKMTNKYCPRGEIKKLDVEMWNLKVKGTDVIGYNQRFQELAFLCVRMFPEESDKIKRYVGGLPDMIHGSVLASKPKTMQEVIEIAIELMDKKICTFAECQADNKRKFDDTSKNNQNQQQQQQQQNKRQNTGRVYTAGSKERTANANTTNNQRVTGAGRNGNAPSKVYVMSNAGTNPDSNIVTSTFLLNNCYASVLFDTGADRSFVSTAFSS
ncbi:putative reverse transcriptase domain-containing protein [Tanacetum coccineum]